MRIVEKARQPNSVKNFGNNTSNIIFFDNGSVGVFEDKGREGGCVMYRNIYDELHLFENDAKFIQDLLSYCRKEIPHQYESLSDYLDTLDWVYTARNYKTLYPNETNPNLTITKISFDVLNRINYNDYVITDTVDSLENAMKVLADCSDFRPNGKSPILGSGRIRERFFYENEKGEILEYAHTVFISHEHCRPEPISSFDREIKRIK